jgi:addiction module HigA family antidote
VSRVAGQAATVDADHLVVATTNVGHLEAFMIRVPTHREPTHPGEMLLEEFLKPMALSQRDLADGIHVPYQRINELVNKKRGMTPSTALRLSRFLGTSADFWMSLQLRWDLYQASLSEAAELKLIKRIKTAGEAIAASRCRSVPIFCSARRP